MCVVGRADRATLAASGGDDIYQLVDDPASDPRWNALLDEPRTEGGMAPIVFWTAALDWLDDTPA